MHRLHLHQFKRSIYLPSSTNAKRIGQSVKSQLAIAEAERQSALLDEQLNEIKAKQRDLRRKIALDQEKKAQEKLKVANLANSVSEEDIKAFESQLKLPVRRNNTALKKGLEIPPSILKLVSKDNSLQLFSINPLSIVSSLPVLSNVPQKDIEGLMTCLPLKHRAKLIDDLERIIPQDKRSPVVQDLFMSCYAELGQPAVVEKLLNESSTLTTYSFSHLAKSYFKTRAPPDVILSVVKRMESKGIKPNLPVMSTLIQSYIQYNQFSEAQDVFDSMKYWSTDSLPDIKLYNSMILCFAKQHNVNKCLDLVSEMRDRRPYPLEPNQETFNYLIYACARDPKTHLAAWEFFIEATNNQFTADRQSFRSLMYLCGSTGEVLLARALIRKLSEHNANLIDDYAVNCLMNGYSRWTPGPSKILASHVGRSIRSNLILSDVSSSPLPLLPTAQLTREIVVAESTSVFEFFAETNSKALSVQNRASASNFPILHNYLRVALNMASLTEFKRRFYRFTKFSGAPSNLIEPSETEKLYRATNQHPQFTVDRGQDLYRLAMQAATVHKSIEFGREIWTERGEWRRTNSFRNLPKHERNRQDFHFARDLVKLLSECGQITEALMVAESAKNLGKWKPAHVHSLLEQCKAMEDVETLRRVGKLFI